MVAPCVSHRKEPAPESLSHVIMDTVDAESTGGFMANVHYAENGMAGTPFRTNPGLVRSGVASTEFFEMTPVIFHDEFLLLGSVHPGVKSNPYNERCLWIEDVATGKVRTTFAPGYGLASAFVDGDTFYAFAIPNDSRGAQHIDCFASTDLDTWESYPALYALEGEELFNETVCKAGDRYIMAYESRDARYPPFTIYFAESDDLKSWRRITGPVYGTDRYTACPSIRFIDGYFYMLYLEHRKPKWWFETFLTRSKDLLNWEQSPKNPVLDPEGSEEINTSDSDLVELQTSSGPVVRMYYCTGDQKTHGTVTWAEFAGTEPEFFHHYYPEG